MASRCCGNLLSLPNQYDTKNPARESHLGGRQEAALFQGLFVARPGSCPGPSRVTNQMHSVGLEMSLEKSLKFRQRKISKYILRSTPDRRTLLSEPQLSPRKRNTRGGHAASRPLVQVPLRHWLLGVLFVCRGSGPLSRGATPQPDRHSSPAARGGSRRPSLLQPRPMPRSRTSTDRARSRRKVGWPKFV